MSNPIRTATRGPNGRAQVILGRGDLTVDAWGTSKVSLDYSLFHGMFTSTVVNYEFSEEV